MLLTVGKAASKKLELTQVNNIVTDRGHVWHTETQLPDGSHTPELCVVMWYMSLKHIYTHSLSLTHTLTTLQESHHLHISCVCVCIHVSVQWLAGGLCSFLFYPFSHLSCSLLPTPLFPLSFNLPLSLSHVLSLLNTPLQKVRDMRTSRESHDSFPECSGSHIRYQANILLSST